VTETTEEYADARATRRATGKVNAAIRPQLNGETITAERTTTGWTTCGCPGTDRFRLRLDGFHDGPGWRPGVVLDPFAGTGTVLAVASGMGRDSLGIDLDSRNADLALERVGPLLLSVERHDPDRPAFTSVKPHNPTGNPRFRVGYLNADGRRNPRMKPGYGEPA
jgi:hypothetical protein